VGVLESYRNWRKERADAKADALFDLAATAFDLPAMLLIRPDGPSGKKFRRRLGELKEMHHPDNEVIDINSVRQLLTNEVRQFAVGQKGEVDSVIGELTDSLSELLQNVATAVDENRTRADEIGEIRSCLTQAEGATTLEDAKKKISAGLVGIQNLVEKEIERQKQLRSSHERYNDQLRQKLNRVEQESRTDSLTGVANRTGIERHLILAADHIRTNGSRPSVAMIDLDRFKEINDVLGHQAGDSALVSFAQRLQAAVGDGVFVGRLGGDEFVVVTPVDAELIERMLHRLNEQLKQRPVIYEGVTLELSCSFGVQVLEAGWKPEQVLKFADAKLYEHKRRTRGHGPRKLAA